MHTLAYDEQRNQQSRPVHVATAAHAIFGKALASRCGRALFAAAEISIRYRCDH